MSLNRLGLLPGSRNTSRRRLCEWGVVLVVGVIYLTRLTAGHVFTSDDFAAYVMHAVNLAEGQPYAAIHYIPNPKALWLAPSNGYPPVYPLLLAPVYRVWGLNLRAFKIVTVLCFVGLLLIFAELVRPRLSPLMSCCALLILGLNPAFLEHGDVLLSEFPYLMFSFGALMVIKEVYKDLSADEFRIGKALLLSVLLYLTYGTRTIGIALLPALALADVIKFKRPSRFFICVLVLTAVFIVAQTVLLTSPTGYISAVQLAPRTAVGNAVFYAKTLSYVWQNGFSKTLQISFALAFTALASARFARKLWAERSVSELYLLVYLAILASWSAEIGMRGLLPILPLYFAYALEQFERIANALGHPRGAVSLTLVLLLVGVTYAGGMRRLSQQPVEANVRDPAAQEMFTFLRSDARPEEVLIFPKPRALALFTNRAVASLAPNEKPEDSFQFMRSIQAPILVKPKWAPPAWQALVDSKIGQPLEVFHNSEYQVFRISVGGRFPASEN